MLPITEGAIHRIIHEELGMKKGVCVCKVGTHFMTEAHTMERVRCAKQMLAMFECKGRHD